MNTEQDGLEPIDPETARELYLDHRETHISAATLQNHRYRTDPFVRWCEEVGIDNLNDLSGRKLHEYRLWRKDDGALKATTISAQMSTLRVFLKWAATIDAVPSTLYEKVLVPRVDPEDEHRSEMLEAETAEKLLDYLSTFHFASINHVLIGLLWETGIRMGSAIAIDVEDIGFDNEAISIVHRPDQGTPLKNGRKGERPVAIRSELAQLLGAYVDNIRNDVSDEFGRVPLLATSKGRMTTATLRRVVYRTTAPCFRGEHCEGCSGEAQRKCGNAVSPHAIRRRSITYHLSNDVPVEIVGDRMNVSRKVLDKHYDRRTEDVKLEQRRAYLDNI